MGTQKYIFVNGIMQTNPEWLREQDAQGGTQKPSAPPMSLAVVSNMQDAAAAGAAQQAHTGVPMQMPQATQDAISGMQSEGYMQKFQAPQALDGGEVVDALTNYFARYEIPLGLVNKLRTLSEYRLNFIVDDSGSMSLRTDSERAKAGDWMAANVFHIQTGAHQPRVMMTRWEEAEDRVHTLIDLLTYIPTGPIKIGFLNRPDQLVLDRAGQMPEAFTANAHARIRGAFARPPQGRTPTKAALQRAFREPPMTMHYLFTDGVPSDSHAVRRQGDDGPYNAFPEIENIVKLRNAPHQSPITFVSCSDEDDDVNWMKVLEEAAPYAAEIDDFVAEAKEVHHDQGPYFPFTKGFWLICLLAAAVNPEDLDAMDESAPFSKMTLDNLLGRVTTEQDYVHYFRSHPQEPVVRAYYQEFATAQATGKQIWLRHRLRPMQRGGGWLGGGGQRGGARGAHQDPCAQCTIC